MNRVVYDRNPLAQVICQLRFPPMLKIGTSAGDDELARFQDRIRGEFPQLSQTVVQFPATAGPPLVSITTTIVREFLAGDGLTKASLTTESLAIATLRYVRWEDFRKQIHLVAQAFDDIYGPAFYTRIGLRYQDQIVRSRLGLHDIPWIELVADQLHGLIASADVKDELRGVAGEALIALDARAMLHLRYGNVELQGDPPEQGFMVDADLFDEGKTERTDANTRIEHLHDFSGHVFRWCIKERLHAAMGPG